MAGMENTAAFLSGRSLTKWHGVTRGVTDTWKYVKYKRTGYGIYYILATYVLRAIAKITPALFVALPAGVNTIYLLPVFLLSPHVQLVLFVDTTRGVEHVLLHSVEDHMYHKCHKCQCSEKLTLNTY